MPRLNLFLALSLLPLIALAFVQGFSGWAQQRLGTALGMKDATCDRTSSLSHRPPILMAAIPAWSHFEKIIVIAEHLAKKGYPVYFMGTEHYRKQIEDAGAEYIQLDGSEGVAELFASEDMAELQRITEPIDQEIHLISATFFKRLPDWWNTTQRALKNINDYRTVYIHDAMFLPLAALYLGDAGLKPQFDIAIGLIPLLASSKATYPFRWGKAPETGPDAEEKHTKAFEVHDQDPFHKGLSVAFRSILKNMGAPIPSGRWTDAVANFNDVFCSMTIPEFQYPRPDWNHRNELIGITRKVGVPDQRMPPWWDEVLEAKKSGKKIIAITASSLDYNSKNLVVPALEAFKDRDDVLMVAAFVNDNPEGNQYTPPKNARVAKFIPMTEFLPHVSLRESLTSSLLTSLRPMFW